MDVTIRAKNFKLATDVEESIRKRIERLTRHLENLQSAEVLLAQQPTRLNPQRFDYVVQITLQTRNTIIRSEVLRPELLTAVDEAMDHLHRQVERYRSRSERKKRGAMGLGKTPASAVSTLPSPAETAVAHVSASASATTATQGGSTNGRDEEVGQIVRVKSFSVKPMFPEDAIEQMELLGHSFYVFYNAADESVNVLYLRKDGNYGLIQPEFS